MIEERQFERMRSRGIIREAEPGRYWLDVVAYDIDMRQRHAVVRTMLLVMVIALAIGLGISVAAR